MQRSALCRSRRELSNAYLLAKFGFDTAENEPFFATNVDDRIASSSWQALSEAAAREAMALSAAVHAVDGALPANLTVLVLGCIEAKFCNKICV